MNNTTTSTDLMPWQKRMIVEYRQLKERARKLKEMLHRYRRGELDFEPVCPIELLEQQYNCMWQYQFILEQRAVLERIDLDSPYDPMDDLVEALAADLCERETMCNDDPHQLHELDAQTQESYRKEARMDIEAALKAVM